MAKQPDLESARNSTVAEIAQYFKRHRKKLKVKVHDGPIKSVRVTKHRGREIKITASYDIRIDGRRLGGHLEVGNDGNVHNHALPNYKWTSMVDMCKQLVDSFPEDLPPAGKSPLRAVPVGKTGAQKQIKKTTKKKSKKATKKTTSARKTSGGRRKAKRG